MATVTEIRTALADVIAAAGIRCESHAPDVLAPPCVVVLPNEGDFDSAFDLDLDTLRFNLRVVVPWPGGRAGQAELDEYVNGSGTYSIRRIIAASPTLGLANTAVRVMRFSGYGQYETPDGAVYGSTVFELEVLTEGDT